MAGSTIGVLSLGMRVSNVVEAGQKFGRLTVLDPEVRLPLRPCDINQGLKTGRRAALCWCECGNEVLIKINTLFSKPGKGGLSCGCLRDDTAKINVIKAHEALVTHGLSNHELYGVHYGMMLRCYDVNSISYKNYGGRGIEVYAPWHDVAVFIPEIETLIGKRPMEYTLDRYPNKNGDYEPSNVRWASWSEQNDPDNKRLPVR